MYVMYANKIKRVNFYSLLMSLSNKFHRQTERSNRNNGANVVQLNEALHVWNSVLWFSFTQRSDVRWDRNHRERNERTNDGTARQPRSIVGEHIRCTVRDQWAENQWHHNISSTRPPFRDKKLIVVECNGQLK